MQFSVFLLIFYLLYPSAIGEQFFYKSSIAKCCKVKQILALNYTCIRDDNGTLYVEAPTILPTFPDPNRACLEILYDERYKERHLIKIDPKAGSSYMFGINHFPKCCPLDSTYDTVDHKCVTGSKFSSLTVELFQGHLKSTGAAVMNIGLSKCDTVIADYEVPSVRNIIFDANHGVFVPQLHKTVSFGTYCIEKIFNSHRYIVRVCSNFDVCRSKKSDKQKFRCIRKCCADGEIFKNRPAECTKQFGYGLVLKNDTKIHYPDEPFAIVQGGRCLSYMGTEDDVYYMDIKGNIRQKIEDTPWLFLSPLKASYCYEYYEDDDMQYIFFCVR